MCFLKVKDGHLTILNDCLYPSFWCELPNCLDLNSMMDGLTIEIYIKLIEKEKKKYWIGALNSDYCGHR